VCWILAKFCVYLVCAETMVVNGTAYDLILVQGRRHGTGEGGNVAVEVTSTYSDCLFRFDSCHAHNSALQWTDMVYLMVVDSMNCCLKGTMRLYLPSRNCLSAMAKRLSVWMDHATGFHSHQETPYPPMHPPWPMSRPDRYRQGTTRHCRHSRPQH
jgi:hypothetical protein